MQTSKCRADSDKSDDLASQETELLAAGFPCIDVSRAGLRQGLQGKVSAPCQLNMHDCQQFSMAPSRGTQQHNGQPLTCIQSQIKPEHAWEISPLAQPGVCCWQHAPIQQPCMLCNVCTVLKVVK